MQVRVLPMLQTILIMATEKKDRNKLKRTSSSYKQGQLDDLAEIARQQSEISAREVSVSELLREGADHVITKYKTS